MIYFSSIGCYTKEQLANNQIEIEVIISYLRVEFSWLPNGMYNLGTHHPMPIRNTGKPQM